MSPHPVDRTLGRGFHSGLEPDSDPPDRLEHRYKTATLHKTIAGSAIAVLGVVATAAVWAHTRPSTAYVDSKVAAVASADIAVHKDFDSRLNANTAQIAELRGSVNVIIDQNREILSEIHQLNNRAAARGEPTPLPPQRRPQ